MSFFDRQTRVIKIDDENTITIQALRRGDQERIATACRIEPTKINPTGAVDNVKMTRMMIEQGIAAWEGPGFDGRDVTPANIAELPSYITDQVLEAVNEFSNLSDDEKKR